MRIATGAACRIRPVDPELPGLGEVDPRLIRLARLVRVGEAERRLAML